MRKLLSVFALFGSLGTLVCCALPALFVTLGFGATFASLIGTFPQLTWLSAHKGWVFGGAAFCLAAIGARATAGWALCLTVVAVDARADTHHWLSVIVFGRYEEIPDAPKYQHARMQALEALQKRTLWWEPACVPAEGREPRPTVFYRIEIEQVTGRRATPIGQP